LYPPEFIYGTKQFARYAEWAPEAVVACKSHRVVPIVIDIDEKGCGTFGSAKVWSGNGGMHLSAFGRWEISSLSLGPEGSTIGGTAYEAIQFWAFPNGYMTPIFLEWTPKYINWPLP